MAMTCRSKKFRIHTHILRQRYFGILFHVSRRQTRPFCNIYAVSRIQRKCTQCRIILKLLFGTAQEASPVSHRGVHSLDPRLCNLASGSKRISSSPRVSTRTSPVRKLMDQVGYRFTVGECYETRDKMHSIMYHILHLLPRWRR